MTPAARTNQIIAEVADLRKMTVKELLADERTQRVAWAKQHVMYELLARTTLSTTQIGAKLGRDHTTIIYGAGRHAERNGLPPARLRAEAEKVAA